MWNARTLQKTQNTTITEFLSESYAKDMKNLSIRFRIIKSQQTLVVFDEKKNARRKKSIIIIIK